MVPEKESITPQGLQGVYSGAEKQDLWGELGESWLILG